MMNTAPATELKFQQQNTDGRGAHFTERVILDNGLGGHEAVVGDVAGAGDIDLFQTFAAAAVQCERQPQSR